MRIFAFDAEEYRGQYADRGWVHIKGGISPEFLEELRAFVRESLSEHHVEGTAIGGSKDQALFEFPQETAFPDEVFDVIAAMAGLNRATMTLSERHVKAYYGDTPPELLPHKDRFASQVSVGLSIDIPAESRLLLYPHSHLEVNPYNISGALPKSLPPAERPEAIAATAEAVEIDDSAGDVVAFRGSAIWHCRRRAAGAVNLYLKMNDFGCDPLGEDPATTERREATLAAVSSRPDLDDMVPVVSRRFDNVARTYLRDSWEDVLAAQVFDSAPVTISAREFELLRALDGRRHVADVLGILDDDRAAATERLRDLADREVIDLLAAG